MRNIITLFLSQFISSDFSLSISSRWARCSFSRWNLLLLFLTEIRSFIYASFHWWKSIRLIFILYWDIKSCLPSIADVHAFDFILVGEAKWTICMRRCDKQKRRKREKEAQHQQPTTQNRIEREKCRQNITNETHKNEQRISVLKCKRCFSLVLLFNIVSFRYFVFFLRRNENNVCRKHF